MGLRKVHITTPIADVDGELVFKHDVEFIKKEGNDAN